MNKIYISGPITQSPDPDKGKKRFRDMVMKIHNMGIGIPVSPRAHRMPPWFNLPEDGRKVWTYMMRLALIDLMECDSMVLLDGWKVSPGCTAELEICKLLDIPVFDEHFEVIHDPEKDNDRGVLDYVDPSELRVKFDNNSGKDLLLDQTVGDSLVSYVASQKYPPLPAPNYTKENK